MSRFGTRFGGRFDGRFGSRFSAAPNAPGQGVGAVSPSTILGSKLVEWWTADRADLITLNGSAVTSWKGAKNGYAATQGVSASRPVYSSSSFNGAPSVTFDGTDDELTCTDAAFLAALPTGAAPGEIWAVLSQDALAADATTRLSVAYGDANSNNARQLRRITNNQNFAAVGTGATFTNTTVESNFSDRAVTRGEYLATETAYALNNGTRRSVSAVPATTATRARVGATNFTVAANFWNGKVRDVIFTNAALTSGEATALYAWALPRRML